MGRAGGLAKPFKHIVYVLAPIRCLQELLRSKGDCLKNDLALAQVFLRIAALYNLMRHVAQNSFTILQKNGDTDNDCE